ncbi:patatin-like phospholipase family protein [Parapedobacter sp. GCM10030251]|uniref:patatin-like phospholipase family protein n=1 Tax=Parapedobacter sp. GCM10030251 TaxID=3273419 RepID=UPI00360CD50F
MAKKNTVSDLPQHNPFQSIALAFSGGGFRAAAFSLGALSYLEHLTLEGVPLTKHIGYISSASGGTITNLLYTSAMHKGVSFDEFYEKTKAKLNGEDLLENVLSVLNDDRYWRKTGDEKRRNLINSFAKVYDDEFFHGETMEVYATKKYVKKFEICCNATEFYRGLSFRFKTDGTKSWYQVIGNKYLRFDDTRIDCFQKLKLADVLAASSCFPMGLEPIIFPEDFTYNDGNNKVLTSQELREAIVYSAYNEKEMHLSDAAHPLQIRSFGLMDGGITDNQALKSLMLADEKRRRKQKPDPFDLMIVTDVSSYFMDYYKVPDQKGEKGWRGKSIDYYVNLFQKAVRYPLRIQNSALAIAIACFAVSTTVESPYACYPSLVLGGMATAVFMMMWTVRKWRVTREILRQPEKFDPLKIVRTALPVQSFSDRIINKIMDYLRLTKLNVLEQMLKARITSVMSMVLDVNLKQVRRLIYEMFYNDERWEDRRVSNFIYELSAYNLASRSNRFNNPKRLGWKATEEDKALLCENLDNITPIAERARKMGTTLWFDKEDRDNDQLANIIKTGQFTTCMNLLEYVISLERKKVGLEKNQLDNVLMIKAQLVRDINLFKSDPGFLFQ